MAKAIENVIRVFLEDDANAEEIAGLIEGRKGVRKVNIVPKDSEIDWMLEEVGNRISEMENWQDLDCPLRSLRHEIEEFLKCDVRSFRFDKSKVMTRKV